MIEQTVHIAGLDLQVQFTDLSEGHGKPDYELVYVYHKDERINYFLDEWAKPAIFDELLELAIAAHKAAIEEARIDAALDR